MRLPRPPRAALGLAAALFLNELLGNVTAARGRLGDAKVMRSVGAELEVVAWRLAGEVAGMLLLAALLLLLVAWGWSAVGAEVARSVRARWGEGRAVRLACAFLTTLVFVNAWYSVHQLLLPASLLRDSPLAMLSGAWHPLASPGVPGLLLPLAMIGAALACTVAALRRSPPLRARLAALALAGTAVIGGFSWWAGPGSGASPPFTQLGNVVLLGVDSLQMNRLTAGGAPRELAPNIDGFLRECRRFDNAWTPLARTYPSWISILTGREPVRHGVRFNLVSDGHLDPGNRYLPQVLAERGWSTLHATDETRFSIIRPRFGFERLVHPPMGAQDFLLAAFFDFSAANLARQTRLGHALFPALRDNRASVAYNPGLFTDDVLCAIDALPRDRPAFIAVHLCGNHWPFSSPAPYAHAADPVEGCIRMVDDQAGALLEGLRTRGLLERSTVVMLSDHGDGWSGDPDDRTNSHGDDFRSAWDNRIVLGLRGPGLEPGVTRDLVRSIDLYPTLLQLAGVPFDPASIDGRSLLPLLAGEAEAPRRLFAETDLDRKVYSVKQLVQESALWYRVDPATGLVFLKEEGFAEFFPLKWYMLVDGTRRLVVAPYLRRFELHELDPRTGCDVPDAAAAAGGTGASPERVGASPRGPVATPADKAALLGALAAHFGLDAQALRADAAAHGFLPHEVARGADVSDPQGVAQQW